MFKSIIPSGSYIVVNGGYPPSTCFNNYSNGIGVGNLRFNNSTQNIQVSDGQQWVDMNLGHVSIGLSTDAENILDWARVKRDEENELEMLAKTNPTVKDLLDQINEKKSQISVIKLLIKDEVKVG